MSCEHASHPVLGELPIGVPGVVTGHTPIGRKVRTPYHTPTQFSDWFVGSIIIPGWVAWLSLGTWYFAANDFAWTAVGVMAAAVVLLLAVTAVAVSYTFDEQVIHRVYRHTFGRNVPVDPLYQAFIDRPDATEEGRPHAVIAEPGLDGAVLLRLISTTPDFNAAASETADVILHGTVRVPYGISDDDLAAAVHFLRDRAHTLELASHFERQQARLEQQAEATAFVPPADTHEDLSDETFIRAQRMLSRIR